MDPWKKKYVLGIVETRTFISEYIIWYNDIESIATKQTMHEIENYVYIQFMDLWIRNFVK